MRAFASDNYAPILPEALDAIAAANHGHATSYGADEWTARLQTAVRSHFGDDAVAFPVFNGTGANVVGLRAMLRPWQGVICAESAHLNVDECGAPEVMGGIKLLTVPTPDGKLTPELVVAPDRAHRRRARRPARRRVGHAVDRARDAVLARGARALREHAHAHGMLFHIDGSRLANAAAALDVGLGDVGVGRGRGVVGRDQGRRAGGRGGRRAATRSSLPRCCTCASSRCSWRRRCASCPRSCWRCSTDDVWRRAAGHANAMAARLAEGVRDAVPLTQDVRANAVFAILPPGAAEELQKDFKFYVWDEHTGEVRWMCSWDTTEEDVDAFVAAILEAALAGHEHRGV